MSSNNIVNFQESTTIFNAHTKKSQETYRMHLVIPFSPVITSNFVFLPWIILWGSQQRSPQLRPVTKIMLSLSLKTPAEQLCGRKGVVEETTILCSQALTRLSAISSALTISFFKQISVHKESLQILYTC